MRIISRSLRSRRINDTDRAIQSAIKSGVPLREAYLANVPCGTRHNAGRLIQGPARTFSPVVLGGEAGRDVAIAIASVA
jgi:hypothetical protein